METCIKEGKYVLYICKYVLKAHTNVLFILKYVVCKIYMHALQIIYAYCINVGTVSAMIWLIDYLKEVSHEIF